MCAHARFVSSFTAARRTFSSGANWAAEQQRKKLLDASADFSAALGIGGAGETANALFRRVLASRLVEPAVATRLRVLTACVFARLCARRLASSNVGFTNPLVPLFFWYVARMPTIFL